MTMTMEFLRSKRNNMYVKYTVLGKVQYAGPYNAYEIHEHCNDIITFVGV